MVCFELVGDMPFQVILYAGNIWKSLWLSGSGWYCLCDPQIFFGSDGHHWCHPQILCSSCCHIWLHPSISLGVVGTFGAYLRDKSSFVVVLTFNM